MADFDINQHLNMMRFGQQGSSDGSANEAMTPDDLLKKGVDKAVQTVTKVISGVLGVHLNSDIEGKGATTSFDAQVGSGFSLTNLGIFRQESGGGFLSMIWELVKKHIVREVNPSIEGINGEGSGGGGGGGGEGSFSDSGSGSSTAMAGGGDMHSMGGPGGGGNDIPDVQVNYGGKMVSAEAMVSNLGNFSPPETPVARNESRGTDMSV